MRSLLIVVSILCLAGCMSPDPPRDVDNVCEIFKEYPKWGRATKKVAKRWNVPIEVQMAIIRQESGFRAQAKPPRTKLLWVIPWRRPSSAYGYSQALDETWDIYKDQSGWLFSSRDRFSDAVDFVGWYANQAYIKAGVSRDDAYALYLSYHEGIGGYQRKTYLQKPWLVMVARKVAMRANIYRIQLARCGYAG